MLDHYWRLKTKGNLDGDNKIIILNFPKWGAEFGPGDHQCGLCAPVGSQPASWPCQMIHQNQKQESTRQRAESPWPLGGRGIRVSAQLGHLPGPSGGPRTPKGMGGTPSDRVGCGAWGEWRGRRGGGRTEPAPLRGRDPTPEGGNWGTTGRAEDQKGAWEDFPYPLGPPGACWDPGVDPLPTRPPLAVGPEGVGGR